MADPMTGAAKIAEEMLKEVQSAMTQADQLAKTQQPTTVNFQDLMQTQQVGEGAGVRPEATDVLRTARAQQAPAVPALGQSLDSRPMMSGLHRMMEDVMAGQNKLEDIINLSLSGRNFSSQELLAMQAGVYRFTQELELTSKVVEKATATIKQTMNTQV